MSTKIFKSIATAAAAVVLFFTTPVTGLLQREDPNTSAETQTAVEPCGIVYDDPFNPYEVALIARTIYGEAGGVKSKAEQAAVAWCILNRVDESGKSIEAIVTAPQQFHGYWAVKGEVPEEFYELAEDVLTRWRMEKKGAVNVGRTLPADYLYFIGDGIRNHFSKEWKSTDYWGWTLKSPY